MSKTVALNPRVEDLALYRNIQMRRRLETATLLVKLLIQLDRQPRFNRVRLGPSLSVAAQSLYERLAPSIPRTLTLVTIHTNVHNGTSVRNCRISTNHQLVSRLQSKHFYDISYLGSLTSSLNAPRFGTTPTSRPICIYFLVACLELW